MKYADFFDPPDGESSANKGSEEDDDNEIDEEMEVDEDADEEQEDGNVAASGEDEEDTDEESTEAVSNFEKKQQKVKLTRTFTCAVTVTSDYCYWGHADKVNQSKVERKQWIIPIFFSGQ